MKTKFTKEDPGDISDLHKYLEAKTGMPRETVIEYPNSKFMDHPHITKHGKIYSRFRGSKALFYFKGKRIGRLIKHTRKGNVLVLTNGHQDFPYDTIFDKITIPRYTQLDEYGVELKPAGKYTMSEGGGWYSKIPMVEVDGKYYLLHD